MKLKLDENFSPDVASLFRERGHDADTVLEERITGISDDDLFLVCRKLSRVLVTLDLDFSNPLRFPPDLTVGIMIIRAARPIQKVVRQTLGVAIRMLESRSIEGELWIVEGDRVRVYCPSGDPD